MPRLNNPEIIVITMKLNKLSYIVAVCCAIASATLLSAASGGGPQPKALRVQILMFSGRPNPSFLITDQKTIGELLTELSALPKNASFNKESVLTPTLGYAGIIVDNVSGVMPDIETIIVKRANIELQRSKGATTPLAKEFRSDGQAALEQRLLALAVKSGALRPGAMEEIKSR